MALSLPYPGVVNSVEAGKVEPNVHLVDQGTHVILQNGMVALTISKPAGLITCIQYDKLENVLEVLNKEDARGYWDLNWSSTDGKDVFDVPHGTEYHIIFQSSDRVELSFSRHYQVGSIMVPLNIDKRFSLSRGHSGFYSYAIYERPKDWPGFNLNQTRITFKLRKDSFQYMAISDNKQRVMPSPDDLSKSRCQQLAYKEAVLLTNPLNKALQGEVDDKYQYSCENKDLKVHGWISLEPLVGFWIIKPTYEFCNGGPLKQNLTSHVGPTCLSMFNSCHYTGLDSIAKFENGEAWQKIFGPVFVYLNSAPPKTPMSLLWENAKLQSLIEEKTWPYDWPSYAGFQRAKQRGIICGRLLIVDKLISHAPIIGKHAFIGLANPGAEGSWQIENKGYQFWGQSDDNGIFVIRNIHAGTYNMYGFIVGFLGDYKGGPISIAAGTTCDLGDVIFSPPRHGPTLWEIGVPNRTAGGFNIPDVDPMYVNRLFINHDERFRQYGLWNRYTELYPDNDLVFTIGTSDWSKDWFFAHVCRLEKDGTFKPTTWQVRFNMNEISEHGSYLLRIATASSNNAALQVCFNKLCNKNPHFDTMQFGRDNAIARHGIHGLYKLWNVDVPSSLLKRGENTLFLTQRKATGPFTGIMYDYLRLEGPPSSSS